MIRLYNCYGEDDKVILIGKREELGVKSLKESEFEYTEELEREYLIFAYNEEHKIFNNGFRHMYEVELLDNLDNIVLYYDENGSLEEFGIEEGKEYSVCYIRYTPEKFRADMKKVYEEGSDFFMNELQKRYESLNGKSIEFKYFYNGENLDLFFTIDLEEIHLDIKIINYFEALVLSVAKDELADEIEVVSYLVNAINNKVKEVIEKRGGQVFEIIKIEEELD
ncbi:MAG: hypothetical protein ACRC2K_11485 [Clostridium sp.]